MLAEGGAVDFAAPVLQSPTVNPNYGFYASMLANLSCITLEQQDIRDSSDVELSSLVEAVQTIKTAWGNLLSDNDADNQVGRLHTFAPSHMTSAHEIHGAMP